MTVESRSVKVVLTAETAQYIREMQKAGKLSADAMSQVERSTKKSSGALDFFGVNTETAALGLATFAQKTVMDFDQSMSQVQAATHETAEGMDLLRQAALDAGADTAFSATEAAGGIENLAKAGLSTADILDGGLAGALDLAAAGELGVADAAEAAAGAMAQFKLEGDQATHVADLLAAGAGKAQGEVSDMVMALKQAGTVSAQTGLSLEETVGSLSALAEQSLLGSDAGTSFKTMLAALTPNSDKARKAMEQYNIQAFDAQGNFVGMTELAAQLQAGLGDLTDEQRAMALETIFGSDAVRAASIIYDNGADGISNWIAQVDDAGFAAETAAIKMDNLKGDLDTLRGAFETAFISGDNNQDALRGITQLATDTINLATEAENADGALGGLWNSAMAGISPLSRLGSSYSGLKGFITGAGDEADAAREPILQLARSTIEEAQSAAEAAAESDRAAAAAERLGKKMGVAAPLTKEQAKALQAARDDARDAAGEFVGLGGSLDDSKVSLSDWIAELQDQANALNSFMDNAKKASKRGLREGLIADLDAAGPAGAMRLRQLANASEEEIARANKAWLNGQKAIDRYVDSVVKVPGSKATTLDLKAMKAIADLIAFRNRLDEATKDRIFTITTQYKTVRSASDALPDRTPRKAGGGLIVGPGTTTSDSVPILASNKEYVVQAAAVDYYGVDYFDAANAMRLAGGGPTDKKKRKAAVEEATDLNQAAQDERDARAEERERRRQEAEALRQERRDADRDARQAEQDRIAEEQARIADAVLEGQQRAWNAAIDAAQAQKDAAKSMVDAVQANMDRIGKAATAAFESPLFKQDSSSRSGLWVGESGSGDWLDALTTDIAGLRERSDIVTQLSGLGIKGTSLEALLGQADNQQIRTLIASGEVGQYASMFAEREALLGSVNAQAGMAGYGQEWTAANAQFTQMNANLETLIAVIASARGITINESVSAQATVDELARLQSMGF